MNYIENTFSIFVIQQYLDHCIETGVSLFAYCLAMAVVLIATTYQRNYTLQYDHEQFSLSTLFVTEDIVAYLLKARTVKPAETSIARERLCKYACC
jgi:hypothetical protein